MIYTKRGKKPLMADSRYPKRKNPPVAKKAVKKFKAKQHKVIRRRKKKKNLIVRFFKWLMRGVWAIVWRVSLMMMITVSLFVGYFWSTLPTASVLLDGRGRGSVTLKDREGETFAWRGNQFGGIITSETVSPALKNAVVATEDRRFFWHFGVSPRGIASAVRINLSEGRGPLEGHGGSTITQQTAKLLCLGIEFDQNQWKNEAAYISDCRRNSLQRKVKEAIYAIAMELKYSKNEILSIYLNRAYMGGGAYGAEAAAQRFFGKHAAETSPAEAAMLAGLLTAPSNLSPTANLQRSQNRAATVLRLMGEQGYLSETEVARWQSEPAILSPAARRKAGGYFADWVMETGPDFYTRNTTEDVIINTTLDQRIQRAAEDALAYVFENKVKEGSKAEAAIVVMGADGAVRAMVGGRENQVIGVFNRAIQAKRQTGSAFKPFVYAAALDIGYSPLNTVLDEPYCLDIPGSGKYCPRNYTNEYNGRVTLTEALQQSLNIPAVKISEAVGRDIIRQVAGQFGLQDELAVGPALALGASESTLLEMTGAYAGILNGGSSVKPYGLIDLREQGESEPKWWKSGGLGERVIQEEAAGQLIWMMEKVVSEGTGQRAQFEGREIAGKTGTTQAARDAWFVGFTADYVAGVWMGYDDNTPLSGVTGGGLPAEIFRETMIRVHEGVPIKPLPMLPPQKISTSSDTSQSGKRKLNSNENFIEKLLQDILGGIGAKP